MIEASIIVVTHNQLKEATEPCLDSLFNLTPAESFELIVVDNASADATSQYLTELQGRHRNVKIQLNSANRGFAGGCNDGLKLASGKYVVFLNNDTLMSEGWLSRLLAPFEADPSIGMVGPVTNAVGNEQRIDLPGLNEANYAGIAGEYISRVRGVWHDTQRLGFFCLATPRTVTERLGMLDETFGLGFFEDDDYCLRALAAGYKLVVVEDCFVFHKGSQSFKHLDSETYRQLVDRNRTYFTAKHGTEWMLADVAIAYAAWLERACDQASRETGNALAGMMRARLPGLLEVLRRIRMAESDTWRVRDLYHELSQAREAQQRVEVRLGEVQEKLNEAQGRITWMEASRSWRVTRPLREVKRLTAIVTRKSRHARMLLATRGLPYVVKFTLSKLRPRRPAQRHRQQLARILEQHQGKPIIVFRPLLDWNLPLYQRPQHMAKCLAELGFLYFFCTVNNFDSVEGFNEVADGCYVTNQFELVDRLPRRKVIHVYAADPKCTWEYLRGHVGDGDIVLYEYIDEIHSDISGREVPRELLERHRNALECDDVICITSADKLHRDASRHRTTNVRLITNGVELDHFAIRRDLTRVPMEIRDVVAKGKPIVGYFGALAKWFDYELILKLARARPNYEVVLIGWNYDQSLGSYKLEDCPNITVLGPIDYKRLPQYACWFDVSTIPFRINEVTESTSPIKLFEYMALGHPIVTTDLPECRKYQSVLIGRDPQHFIARIDEALSLRDDSRYRARLHQDATDNTWRSKAGVMAEMVRDNLSRPMKGVPLAQVQDEIAACDQAYGRPGHYAQTYRHEEARYWYPALRWVRGLTSVDRVADIGPGYGTLLIFSIQCHHPSYILAVDAGSYLAPTLVEKYKIHLVRSDIERSNVEEFGQFDLILFTEILEHLNFHPRATLQKLRQLVSSKGRVVLTTPDAAEWGRVTTYYSSLDAMPSFTGQPSSYIDDHVWQYTRPEVEKLVAEAGFEVEDMAYAAGTQWRHQCFLLRPALRPR